MEYAIQVLEKAETTLMKKVRNMKDGSPKWMSMEKLRTLREAISLIKNR